MKQTIVLLLSILSFFILSFGGGAFAQGPQGLNVIHVQGNVYMIAGAGANITVQIGPGGVLFVDTGLEANSGKVLTAVRQLSSEPIRYIINTGFRPDHTGGNAAISKAGERLAGGGGSLELIGHDRGSAQIFAVLNALNRMSDAGVKSESLPSDTFATPKKELYVNDEGIQIIHEPAANT